MILAFTGSRPQKLGGFQIPNPTYTRVVSEIENVLLTKKPKTVISGMALGVDQWVAELCIKHNIPFIGAIPFVGQEIKWPEKSIQHYEYLKKHANELVYVSEPPYTDRKLQIRNEWMVDNCNEIVAIYDQQPSGTHNCVMYAQKKNKQITIINPFVPIV